MMVTLTERKQKNEKVQGREGNSVFNVLFMSVCGIFRWMPFTSNWIFKSNSRKRSGLEITDLGDIGAIRTVRVNEMRSSK